MSRVRHSLRRTAGGFAAGVLVLAIAIAGDVKADPAADALARLDELSQQALQTREAVTAAQHDADDKLAAKIAAENRHRADLVALDAANSQLASNQAAADQVAAMTYVSGRTGQLAAVLTAGSPKQLIDQLSIQRIVVAETAEQMTAFQVARERAAAAARASETSAADARAAAERSAAVRADLQAKWKELQRQITAAEAQYEALSPAQQAVVDNAAALPPPPPGPPPPADPAIIAMPAHLASRLSRPRRPLSWVSRRRCPPVSRLRAGYSPTPSWLPAPSAPGSPDCRHRRGTAGLEAVASERPGHRHHDPQPRKPRGHRARKRDSRVRDGQCGPIRATGCDLARHVLHAGRSGRIGLRALRPCAHHHDTTPLNDELPSPAARPSLGKVAKCSFDRYHLAAPPQPASNHSCGR